jgi:hypothetical protein
LRPTSALLLIAFLLLSVLYDGAVGWISLGALPNWSRIVKSSYHQPNGDMGVASWRQGERSETTMLLWASAHSSLILSDTGISPGPKHVLVTRLLARRTDLDLDINTDINSTRFLSKNEYLNDQVRWPNGQISAHLNVKVIIKHPPVYTHMSTRRFQGL